MNRKLKVLLITRGIRNFDLAKKLDCDPAKVSKIVNGWLDPDVETKRKIATFLKVKVADIWRGDLRETSYISTTKERKFNYEK